MHVKDTFFSGNPQININVNGAELHVHNSTFTNGSVNHIRATKSRVMIDQVNMFNSTDAVENGHGVHCIECKHLEVRNSNFTNLAAARGGAIDIIDMMG